MQQYWREEVDKHGGKVVNHVIGNSVTLYILVAPKLDYTFSIPA